MRRRQVLTAVAGTVTGLSAGCLGGTGDAEERPAFVATSPAVVDGGTLPTRFTCDGAGDSPPVVFERVPDPTAALAVTVEVALDTLDQRILWSLWNLPPETERVPAGVPRTPTVESLGGARQGRAGEGTVGYEPTCPPPGRAFDHRIDAYALSEELAVEAGTTHDTATEAIGDAVLASERITVTYRRESTATPES
jgi:phosphatidylethanolamine-binding protein (PEBP) family uncharacterized protein